jgi:hypothetical protein
MLEIDLYNRNLDFTLFSKSEISEIKKKYGDDIIPNSVGKKFGVKLEFDNTIINYSLTQEIPVPRKNVLCVWYFIDGVSQRKGDFPVGSKRDYMRFTVQLDDFKDVIVFYKSNKSERWWMEVPYPAKEGSKYERHHMAPCDREDYDNAMKNVTSNVNSNCQK